MIDSARHSIFCVKQSLSESFKEICLNETSLSEKAYSVKVSLMDVKTEFSVNRLTREENYLGRPLVNIAHGIFPCRDSVEDWVSMPEPCPKYYSAVFCIPEEVETASFFPVLELLHSLVKADKLTNQGDPIKYDTKAVLQQESPLTKKFRGIFSAYDLLNYIKTCTEIWRSLYRVVPVKSTEESLYIFPAAAALYGNPPSGVNISTGQYHD